MKLCVLEIIIIIILCVCSCCDDDMQAADADWSEKYRQRSRGLPSKTAAHYGGQILQVIKTKLCVYL